MAVLRFIDLFAGIGGLRLGFERAAASMGLQTECVLSSEIDTSARLVYSLNFHEQSSGDIHDIQSLPPHDVLLAGFPCQPFSHAGRKIGFLDTRGTLFFEIMRLIDTQRPEILIFENVRGMTSHDGGRTLEAIRYEVESRGYHFSSFLLNSANFGLPQNRTRLYMIGVRNNDNPSYRLVSDPGPKDSHSYFPAQRSLFGSQVRPPTVADILEDDPPSRYDCSPEFVSKLSKAVGGHLEKLHGMRLIDYRGGNSIHSWELGMRGECSPREIEFMNRFILERRKSKFGRHQDGKLLSVDQIRSFYPSNDLDAILESLASKKYIQVVDGLFKPVSGNFSFEVYKFLDPTKISVTLVASDANRIGVYHNGRVRRITPLEAARLQGFPDEFQLHTDDNKAYFQLGNSVSINVVEAVAREALNNASFCRPNVQILEDRDKHLVTARLESS